ncbi:hypothetical protein G7046_g8229 [Stylonectria norvegica]|nr:hypothetical protein G7046_g8229 [Stylonectria norvegica]
MTSVPDLQNKLYKRMGLDVPEQTAPSNTSNGRRPVQKLSRKEQRKAQRVQQKNHRYSRPTPPARSPQKSFPPAHARPAQSSTPQVKPRPILKQQPKPSKRVEKTEKYDEVEDAMSLDETEEDDEEEHALSDGDDVDVDEEDEEEDDEGNSEDDEDDNDDDDEQEEHDEESNARSLDDLKGMPKAVQERIAQDDAEIEQFERKLGIRKGRKSLPQSFKEDGLNDLLGDLSTPVEHVEDETSKRKSEYDDWLASKRRKTARALRAADNKGSEDEDDDMGDEEIDGDMDGLDDDYDDDHSFDGFDSDSQENTPSQPRQRENPYIAPTTGVTMAKYVPPSLRKAAGSEGEAKTRLQKQVQGLINRLTDGNILSIVQSFGELYQKNARGDVTDVITDAILTQIFKPESLPDQFFVLMGGFAAAIYRITGSSFGSHLLRRLVTDISVMYEQASKDADGPAAIQKEASNLMTFLSQLYIFEVVTCKILFDYMERFLSDLTEMNVELLLRICRMAGRLMRRDDPQSLKHVASVLSQEVSKTGYANVSVRTKFMIETITDLKNAKPKARGMDSAVVSEHVQRMKKRLGELKSQSRRLDGLAPMGMGLADIEGADIRGKWWLVGASVPAKSEGANGTDDTQGAGDEADSDNASESSDNEDMDIVLPDYSAKARAQGFSGMAQVSIFTALMSASNSEHGYRQFVNLRLKKDDQVEIARVLVQCVGSEAQYNNYYALVGRQACANSRVRFAFQDRLWKIFRGLGESLFGEEPDDDETADGERMKDERRVSNVARFYASLLADGALTIAILKPLELPEANKWTSAFVQWLLIALLQECRGKGANEDTKVEKLFGAARELPGLAAGIHWVLRKKVRKTKLISAKEAKKIEGVREKALAAVQATSAV